MKRYFIYGVFLLVLVLNSSCDMSTETDIIVINESSYDLHINFVVDERRQSKDDYKDIEITKNETIMFKVGYFATGYNDYPRPDIDIKSIIFTDLVSRKVIKAIDNNLKDIFIFIESNGGYAKYLLKITDNLLE
jgi:hypothetical protein